MPPSWSSVTAKSARCTLFVMVISGHRWLKVFMISAVWGRAPPAVYPPPEILPLPLAFRLPDSPHPPIISHDWLSVTYTRTFCGTFSFSGEVCAWALDKAVVAKIIRTSQGANLGAVSLWIRVTQHLINRHRGSITVSKEGGSIPQDNVIV